MQTRREFLRLTLAAVGAESTLASAKHFAWMDAALHADVLGDLLPRQPLEKPLDWPAMAEAFHAYVADPSHSVGRSRPDGTRYVISALEGKNDGGLTTFGPLVLGSILRGENVSDVAPSLAAYFSESEGLFLDGTGADLCEYWYMMNVNALAFAIIRKHFPTVPIGRARSAAAPTVSSKWHTSSTTTSTTRGTTSRRKQLSLARTSTVSPTPSAVMQRYALRLGGSRRREISGRSGRRDATLPGIRQKSMV